MTKRRRGMYGGRRAAFSYLGRRFSGETYALDHQLAILGGDEEVALQDLRLVGRHQDAQPGESRAQRRLPVVRRRGLTLVRAVVLEFHRVYVQREIAWKQSKMSRVSVSVV